MRLIVAVGLAGLALTGCAHGKKTAATCEMNIREQNAVLDAAIVKTFGKAPLGYNTLVKIPRERDVAGRIVLESYRIYPMVEPEPAAAPEGRRLTVVVDPCAKKAVKVFEPA